MTGPRAGTEADQHGGVATARAEAVLSRLQLLVTRKLDGLLQGDYIGLLPGPGTEAGESREYRPGDDVRRMDWPVTARTTVPHVRRTVADRELETWMAVDLSASLDFGTAKMLKRELAIAAAASVAHLTVRGGNRIGAVIGTGDGHLTRLPARPGRKEAQGLLRAIARTPVLPGRADLGALIDMLNRPPRRRGVAVVISDFLAPPAEWGRPLRKLGVRHDVLAVEVVDPRELELPDVGVLLLADPETGRTARGADRRPQAAGPVRAGRGRPARGDRVRAAGGRRPAPAAAYGLRLAPGYRPVRRRTATRTYARYDTMIRFLQPWWLLAVLPVLLLAGVYVWRQLRRREYAMKFTNVDLLRTLVPKGIGWRRHVGRHRVPDQPRGAGDRDGPPVDRPRAAAGAGDRDARDRRVAVDAGRRRGADPAGGGAGGRQAVRRRAAARRTTWVWSRSPSRPTCWWRPRRTARR